MTEKELVKNDGREGRRAYVAVNGKVYDVTTSPHWPGGDHKGRHRAGCDLTEELKQAPHVRAVIERFPVVGSLESKEPEGKRGGGIGLLVAAVLAGIVALVFFLRS